MSGLDSFGWFHGAQCVFVGVLLWLIAERVWTLCWVGCVDADALLRHLPHRAADALKAVPGTFVAQTLQPLLDQTLTPSEREVSIEEALIDARNAILVRLMWIRIGATFSTFLGLVGTALYLGWMVAGDHGLLGLDPTRVAARGLNGAAMSLALGVGGSSLGLGTWMALRPYATRLVGECERAADRVRGLTG